MLYVIRHGQTDWNLNNKLQGRTDIELNDNGRQQAKETKNALIDIKFDYVFCSPLKRAMETCKIVTDEKIVVDERLLERNYGELEGNYKNTYNKSDLWQENFCPPYANVETLEELQERVFSFLNEIKKYGNKNILLVSHAGTIRMIYKYFMGSPISNNLLEFSSENGAFQVFNFEDK